MTTSRTVSYTHLTHAYEHVNLSNLTDAAAIEQVDKTNAAIHEIIGVFPEYIRPPFGCWKPNLDYETTMIEVLWDVDPKDWATSNSSVIAQRVLGDVAVSYTHLFVNKI